MHIMVVNGLRLIRVRLVVLLALLMTAPALADVPLFQRLSMADGLSQSSIEGMAECDDGFLWFGTQFGLDRWDGHAFRSWRHVPDDKASLSHSAVTDLKWSSNAGLWVATRRGLNLFDTLTGRAERFDLPPNGVEDSAGYRALRILAEAPDGTLFLETHEELLAWRPDTRLIETLVFAQPLPVGAGSQRSGVVDRLGRFWLVNGAGLWRLDEGGQTLVLVRPLAQAPEFPLYRALTLSNEGLLAIVSDQRLELVDPNTHAVVQQLERERLGLLDQRFNAVFAASDGSLWLSMSNSLVQYFPATESWEVRFTGSRIRRDIDTRQHVDVAAHPNGDLWFSSQYGLAQWSEASQAVRFHSYRPGDPSSVPPSSLGAGYLVFIDSQETVWVGSRLGGLARLPSSATLFEHIENRDPDADSLFSGLNIVRSIVEQTIDGQLNLWLALDHGGIRRLARDADGQFRRVAGYNTLAEVSMRLPGNAVWSLALDPRSERIWAVENGYLIVIDGRSGQIERVQPLQPARQGGRLTAVAFSESGNSLWVGTTAGVYGFSLDETRLAIKPLTEGTWLPGIRVFNLLPERDGRMLVAGHGAVGLLEPQPGPGGYRARRWPLPEPVEVFGLARHADDGWWLGTRERGLIHLWLNDQDEFQSNSFGRDRGLVDDTVYAILPEPSGRLWLSSNRGLMRWDPETGKARHFTPMDGIQSFEFNHAVAHRGASGVYYFGGINGVNAFFPDRIDERWQVPRVVLDGLSVSGQALPLPARQHGQLSLSRQDGYLDVQMVALAYPDVGRVRYSYRLLGLDDAWVNAGSQRTVRYVGLPPGRYQFQARASNRDGRWSEPVTLLDIDVPPALWQSGWFWLGMVAVVGLLVFMLMYRIRRSQQVLEQRIAERTRELTEKQAVIQCQARELERSLENRTLFFASVSHEFRTPLTLIEASLQRLEGQGGDRQTIARGRRHVRQLLRLVEQLLDLSRIRFSAQGGEARPWSLAPVARHTVEAFDCLADQRGLTLEALIESGWVARFRQKLFEKILLNLLTNAFKFTPEGGRITVRLTEGGAAMVCLEVKDDGPGIPAHEQALIFERFRRAEAAERSGQVGAGIGLALVREAVVGLGGRLELDSAPGKGSCFRVFLPASPSSGADEPVEPVVLDRFELNADQLVPEPESGLALDEPPSEAVAPVKRGLVLVVEDNPELRAHLCEILGKEWRTCAAGDGEQALELAASRRPDVIVSDIMMPRMDGFELLKRLRACLETSHIPVLLLTARSDAQTRLRGLSLSADDFVSKPFRQAELLIRLKRMIENRERVRRRLANEAGWLELSQALPAEQDDERASDLSERDRQLLQKIEHWLDQHAHESGHKVDDLASAMALERRTLQRKLKVLTGQTPAAYIRQYRFRRAARLLKESDQTVTDIALACGFASPQHFSRTFREHYGAPPEQWRQQVDGPAADASASAETAGQNRP